MGTAVEAVDLSKSYFVDLFRPRRLAFEGVSFSLEEGRCLGLLGPNGAGKTSLVKTFLGLVRRDAGEAAMFGVSIDDPGSRCGVAYVPENVSAYSFLEVREYLLHYGGFLAVDNLERRVEEALERTGMASRARVRLGECSKGMRQRVDLARALLSDPSLIFLDEPMSGLDPAGQRTLYEILAVLKEQGTTLVLCSHNLAMIEEIADDIGIMAGGRLVRFGRLEELTSVGGWSVRCEADAEGVVDEVLSLPVLKGRVRRNGCELVVEGGREVLDALLAALVERKVGVSELAGRRRSLWDVYMEAVGAAEGESASAGRRCEA